MDQFIQEPVTAARAAPARPGTGLAVRIGLVGVAVAAIVAVGILAAGMIASPSHLLAADDSSGAQTTPLGPEDFGPGPGGPGFGARFGGITITAINGSNISLETADGWTRTITVDSSTTYWKSGDTIALSDLQVGDQVRFRQTLEDDGSWTIDALAVIPPHVGGQVTAVDGSTITVERRDGTTATIKVTGDTQYTVDGDSASLADVKVDMFLVAEGTKNSDGSLTATEIRAASFGDRPGFGPRGGPGFGHMGDGHMGEGPRGFWDDGVDSDDGAAPDASGSAS